MGARMVGFQELFNFRDLGGYPTVDGGTVAWRRLYRSDSLSCLRGEDQDRFTTLGIRTVVDLRRPSEIAKHGRIPEIEGVAYHHLHLVHPKWEHREYVSLADRTEFLLARYAEMTEDGAEAIGAALRLIAQDAAAPLVVHCYAGKDRTGLVAALTLALLGVDDETIAQDYALSEEPDAALRAHLGYDPAAYVVVPAGVMLGYLGWLRERYGSVEGYAKSVGVSAEQIDGMRVHLLD